MTEDELKQLKRPRRTWRRVILSIIGIIIIAIHWRWAVNHVYALAMMHYDAALTAFVSITTAAFYGITIIVVFLVTGLTFFSWAQSSNIVSNLAAQIRASQSKPKKDDDNGNGNGGS